MSYPNDIRFFDGYIYDFDKKKTVYWSDTAWLHSCRIDPLTLDTRSPEVLKARVRPLLPNEPD
jgi:hypothetical protein